MLIEELAEAAYNAYGATLQWKSATDVRLAYWSELSPIHKTAWLQATEKVAVGYAKACNVHTSLPFWQLRESTRGEGDGKAGGRVPRPRDGVGAERAAEPSRSD